ncbi:hypothetical protein Brsp07_04554 [Brucella sp. NBRC 14130]|uniref:hypothetical protein n=1 Tax=Brucella sp. NBRC 14130 TaxID=3075483 RepID=UPI00309DE9D5
MQNKQSGLLKSCAAGALSMMILMTFAAPASAEKALTGLWSGEDDLAINFDERWVDLGPDTGCKIASLKSTGSNRWRMRITCGVADQGGGFKDDTTLQLKGSTLLFTTRDGTGQLRRQGD